MENVELETGWFASAIHWPEMNRQHLREVIDLDDSQEWWDKSQVDYHYEMMSDLHKSQRMMRYAAIRKPRTLERFLGERDMERRGRKSGLTELLDA